MPFKFEVPRAEKKTNQRPTPPPETKPSGQNATPNRDPYRRACEYEPGYNWRTDPYYDEDAIRERMKAAKAKENTT